MENPADTLDQADEDILTYTASDDALEAAAGFLAGNVLTYYCDPSTRPYSTIPCGGSAYLLVADSRLGGGE
jgi:hypothetical protein